MNLEKEYKEILDKSLRKHFPSWDEMSALDPIKLFAEAIEGSLADVERRYQRHSDVLLDSLPSLFSFQPKPAVAPWGLFSILPTQQLNQVRELPENTLLKFQNDKHTCLVQLPQKAQVQPIGDFAQLKDNGRVRLTLNYRGTCNKLTFFYLQPGEAKRSVMTHLGVAVILNGARKSQPWPMEKLVIEDNTNQFTQSGSWSIACESEIFCEKGGAFELSLTFQNQVPVGEFAVNIAKGVLFEAKENYELGYLKGEPWEEIPLPDRAMGPPLELDVLLPNEETLRLQRLDHDLLKIRHAHEDRFARGFFYHGTHHSLIVPQAHQLLGGYLGGVRIQAPSLKLLPPFAWIPEECKYAAAEFTSFVDGVQPVCSMALAQNRETTADYLGRFYSLVRNFQSSQRSRPVFQEEEIRLAILNCDPSIRMVEVELEEKTLNAYLMVHHPSSFQMVPITESLRKKVEDLLMHSIPVDYQFRVLPFRSVPVSLNIEGMFSWSVSRVGLIPQQKLEQIISEHLLRLLLPVPYGILAARKTVSRQELFTELAKLLVLPQEGIPLRKEEITQLHGWFVDAGNGRYLESITRNPGELFKTTIQVEAKMGYSHGYSEEELPSPGSQLGLGVM